MVDALCVENAENAARAPRLRRDRITINPYAFAIQEAESPDCPIGKRGFVSGAGRSGKKAQIWQHILQGH
jgi:hypothetical protein